MLRKDMEGCKILRGLPLSFVVGFFRVNAFSKILFGLSLKIHILFTLCRLTKDSFL